MATYNIAIPIDTNNPIGYTDVNLFNALSVCNACTHRGPSVDFPIKLSPSKRNNPKGIRLAVREKNNTSL